MGPGDRKAEDEAEEIINSSDETVEGLAEGTEVEEEAEVEEETEAEPEAEAEEAEEEDDNEL